MKPGESIDMLWQNYAAGNKDAFEDIYLHYYPDLYAYGRSISTHTEVIDGAIQDLFMTLWRKPPKGVSGINQYIFVSFRNQLYRSLTSSFWVLPKPDSFFQCLMNFSLLLIM